MTQGRPTMTPGLLRYRVRDGGYGVEEGAVFGWFTGEVDYWGKRTFQESSELGAGVVYYFLDDECDFTPAPLDRGGRA